MLIKMDRDKSKVEYVNFDAVTGFNTEIIRAYDENGKDNLYRVRLYCYVSEPSVHNAYPLFESEKFHKENWDGYESSEEYLDVYNSMLDQCVDVLHAILGCTKTAV